MNETIYKLREMSDPASSSKPTALTVKARRSSWMTLAVYCCDFRMLLV